MSVSSNYPLLFIKSFWFFSASGLSCAPNSIVSFTTVDFSLEELSGLSFEIIAGRLRLSAGGKEGPRHPRCPAVAGPELPTGRAGSGGSCCPRLGSCWTRLGSCPRTGEVSPHVGTGLACFQECVGLFADRRQRGSDLWLKGAGDSGGGETVGRITHALPVRRGRGQC